MGRRLVPASIVAAALAFAAAALAAAAPVYPTAWPAALALAILGGIAPMIAAVNIRVAPVFTRSQWRSQG